MDAASVLATRELFWQDVMRELLTSLAGLSASRPSEGQPPDPAFDASLFDGRLAVMTRDGERIALAAVTPILSCGPAEDVSRSLAMAVACTAFEFRTPDGHVFTLPLSEIRAFHTLTQELLERLTAASRRRSNRKPEQASEPFGFAAFTAMARGLAPEVPGRAPEHPME